MEEDFRKCFSLRIWVSKENFTEIDKILGIKTNQNVTTWWILEYFEKENDEYIPYIEKFLSLLEGKYDQLKKIGIERNDISVWELYAYDGQCNMEFSPKNMYALGKEGITLCISCWDIHDYDADEYDENGKLIIKD
jgi:hypothetical protein